MHPSVNASISQFIHESTRPSVNSSISQLIHGRRPLASTTRRRVQLPGAAHQQRPPQLQKYPRQLSPAHSGLRLRRGDLARRQLAAGGRQRAPKLPPPAAAAGPRPRAPAPRTRGAPRSSRRAAAPPQGRAALPRDPRKKKKAMLSKGKKVMPSARAFLVLDRHGKDRVVVRVLPSGEI